MIRAGELISMMVNKCKYRSNSGSKTFSFEALPLAPSPDSGNYGNLKMMEEIQIGLHRDTPAPCLERTSKISAPLRFSTSCSSDPVSSLPSHEQKGTRWCHKVKHQLNATGCKSCNPCVQLLFLLWWWDRLSIGFVTRMMGSRWWDY